MKPKDGYSIPSKYELLRCVFTIIRTYCGALDEKKQPIISYTGIDLVFQDLFEMLGIPESCSLEVFSEIEQGWLKRAPLVESDEL
jgi:hypothetical protein